MASGKRPRLEVGGGNRVRRLKTETEGQKLTWSFNAEATSKPAIVLKEAVSFFILSKHHPVMRLMDNRQRLMVNRRPLVYA